jgi:hypothetical protein
MEHQLLHLRQKGYTQSFFDNVFVVSADFMHRLNIKT